MEAVEDAEIVAAVGSPRCRIVSSCTQGEALGC